MSKVTTVCIGKALINEETALIQQVLGNTAAFWLNREAQYRAALVGKEENCFLKRGTL